MSVHLCPDCHHMNDKTNCRTCMGSAYVHRRASDGRITHPADPKEFLDSLPPSRPKTRPSRF